MSPKELSSTANKENKKPKIRLNNRNFGIIAITFGVGVLVSILSPWFLTSENIINVLRQNSFLFLLAMSETMVIISGGIDLSVGPIVSLSGCLAAYLVKIGVSIPLALLAGIIAGSCVGLVNGLLVTIGRMEPYLATLSMQILLAGGILYVTQGVPIVPFKDAFTIVGRGYIGFMPVPIIVVAIVGIAIHIMMSSSVFGRHIYAVGGNRKAAKVSGINLARIIVTTFIISGSLAGLSGVMLASRMASGQPSGGNGMELYAIAASVVGGASFSGGQGTIYGTLSGVVLIAIIGNALNLLNISSFLHQVVIGSVIVITVIFDRRMKRKEL